MQYKYPIIMLFFMAVPIEAAVLSIKAKMTVKVIDEQTIPIKGAKVTVSFTDYPVDRKIECFTDEEGECNIKGDGSIDGGIRVTKEGFYYSYIGFKFKTNQIKRLYEPYGETYEVVLKKKKNPVPMKAKHTRSVKIPVFDSPVGYDLEKGDWVGPYGKGLIEDFVFNFHCDHETPGVFECSYVMTFSNEMDGIQKYVPSTGNISIYRWPYEAPLEGYESSLFGKRSRKSNGFSSASENEHMKYIFRVRSNVDDKGNIIDARYGKMDGDIKFYPAKIMFTYYFNPEGTRNLEFDPEQNLFKFSRDEFLHEVQLP